MAAPPRTMSVICWSECQMEKVLNVRGNRNAAIANVFEHKNGVWVRDNAIYPVNFERTWKLGAKFSF